MYLINSDKKINEAMFQTYGDAPNPGCVVPTTARLDKDTLSSGLLSTINFIPDTSDIASLDLIYLEFPKHQIHFIVTTLLDQQFLSG